MEKFSQQHDVVIFVSGRKSSNGKALHGVCKEHNPRSYFIESSAELNPSWFDGIETVGVCGATSTPMWLMEEVAQSIRNLESVPEISD